MNCFSGWGKLVEIVLIYLSTAPLLTMDWINQRNTILCHWIIAVKKNFKPPTVQPNGNSYDGWDVISCSILERKNWFYFLLFSCWNSRDFLSHRPCITDTKQVIEWENRNAKCQVSNAPGVGFDVSLAFAFYSMAHCQLRWFDKRPSLSGHRLATWLECITSVLYRWRRKSLILFCMIAGAIKNMVLFKSSRG